MTDSSMGDRSAMDRSPPRAAAITARRTFWKITPRRCLRVSLESGREMTSPLVVGADDQSSVLVDALGGVGCW